MRSGLRPGHSVAMMTWTSEMSGTASSGVVTIAHTPTTARTAVPVKTRKRLSVHHSMSREIMGPEIRTWFDVSRSSGEQGELATRQGSATSRYRDGHIPAAGHRDLAGAAVRSVACVRQPGFAPHRRVVHRRHRGHEEGGRHVGVGHRLTGGILDDDLERRIANARRIGLRAKRDAQACGWRALRTLVASQRTSELALRVEEKRGARGDRLAFGEAVDDL